MQGWNDPEGMLATRQNVLEILNELVSITNDAERICSMLAEFRYVFSLLNLFSRIVNLTARKPFYHKVRSASSTFSDYLSSCEIPVPEFEALSYTWGRQRMSS
jgi:hypothetical protein